MSTTPARLARAGVVLSLLAATGIITAVLVAGTTADPTIALVAATAAVIAMTLAAVRIASVAPRRTVTVGRRAGEHTEPLSELPAPAHPDTDGRVRSRAPGRPVPAV